MGFIPKLGSPSAAAHKINSAWAAVSLRSRHLHPLLKYYGNFLKIVNCSTISVSSNANAAMAKGKNFSE